MNNNLHRLHALLNICIREAIMKHRIESGDPGGRGSDAYDDAVSNAAEIVKTLKLLRTNLEDIL